MNRHGRSRNARLNQARTEAMGLLDCLTALACHPSGQHVDQKDMWQDGRNALERLVQCFHEANAYNNAMLGAAKNTDRPLASVVGEIRERPND